MTTCMYCKKESEKDVCERCRGIFTTTTMTLPETERHVIALHNYEGLSFQAISEILKRPKDYIQEVHKRGTDKLYARVKPLISI